LEFLEMSDDRPDHMTMIGLHKLAEQVGDGMVPELYTLLREQALFVNESGNVTPFPLERTRLPRRSPYAISTLAHALGTHKILSFPSSALERDERRKRQG
jgi:hypothetical protein